MASAIGSVLIILRLIVQGSESLASWRTNLLFQPVHFEVSAWPSDPASLLQVVVQQDCSEATVDVRSCASSRTARRHYLELLMIIMESFALCRIQAQK
jgi:hypothetical protein